MMMSEHVIPLDARTALSMELGRGVDDVELLEWMVHGVPTLSRRAAAALRGRNLDLVIASLEGTLMEKLEIQEAVYARLGQMLESPATTLVASELLAASTSTEASELLQAYTARAFRTA